LRLNGLFYMVVALAYHGMRQIYALEINGQPVLDVQSDRYGWFPFHRHVCVKWLRGMLCRIFNEWPV